MWDHKQSGIDGALLIAASIVGAACAGTPTQEADAVEATGASLEASESCLEGIDATDRTGPFRYDTEDLGRVNLWVPRVPSGCRVPVIHLANGTGARCSMYRTVLTALASHGFLTACYEDTNTGAGTQGVEAIETARAAYPDLVSNKIGSMGHSQGGQAAFTVLAGAEDRWGDAFAYAGLAMQPASGFGDQPFLRSWQSVYATVDSPMFMFSGSADILVSGSWVQRGFNALSNDVEAYYWEKAGSTHIPVPNDETVEVGVPWFRWKLLGDQDACEDFYRLRSSFTWSVEDEQNARACGQSSGESGGGRFPWF